MKKQDWKKNPRTKHLIPQSERSPEERTRIARMGGSVKSPAKTLAMQLNGLKRRGVTDATCKRLHEIMIKPETSALDIRAFIEKIRESPLDPKEMIRLGHLMIQWHKAFFGEKKTEINAETLNAITVNITQIKEEVKDFIETTAKEKEEDNEDKLETESETDESI